MPSDPRVPLSSLSLLLAVYLSLVPPLLARNSDDRTDGAPQHESSRTAATSAERVQIEYGQADHSKDDSEQGDEERVGSKLPIEIVLMAEHALAVQQDLDASGCGRDAALALLISPLSRMVSLSDGGRAETSGPQAAVRWDRLIDDLDSVPVDLLHALASAAERQLDPAQWARYEEELLQRDARNLAAWLHRIDDLAHDPAALDTWLARAAERASILDSLNYAPLAAMIEALVARPLSPELSSLWGTQLELTLTDLPEEGLHYSDAELWMIPALGSYMAIAIPAFQPFAEACSVLNASLSHRRRESCIRLASKLQHRAGNGVDHGILLGIWRRLAEGTPQEAEALAAERVSKWEMERVLLLDSWPRWRSWVEYVQRPGATERGWLQQQLAADGLPAEPPADWQPMLAEPLSPSD